jgi:hypothetical protein
MASLQEAVQRVEGIPQAFQEQDGIRWAITLRDGEQFLEPAASGGS